MQDVIFDTDMGNDIDDALALATLHALQSRGRVRLRAVTVTRVEPASAVFCDALNRYYGRLLTFRSGSARSARNPAQART